MYREIAQVIGRTAAAALVTRLGGVRLYVPQVMTPEHEIAVAIGADAAERLVDHYGGTEIYVPVAAERREAVRRLGGRMKPKAIARETGYTERQVYRILGSGDDARQPSLFGDDPAS